MTRSAQAPDRPSARDLREIVLDAGTWTSWDRPVDTPGASQRYAGSLARARERSGLDESVITGEGRIRGRRVAVVACEFGFMAGTIGVAAGQRLVDAIERATRERLPLLASPSSGGTRLQEGAVAFLQMIRVTGAVIDHKAAGLPYIVYLRHPTTGGVLASWGSLGHLTAAEPEALIGFLGPRVYEALHGEPFPEGVQVAEHLHANGLVDAVLAADQVADAAHRVLQVVQPGPTVAGDDAAEEPTGDNGPADAGIAAARATGGCAADEPADAGATDATDTPAAVAVRISRSDDRPGLRDLLSATAGEVTPLSGTGAGEREPGLVVALARFGSASCLVVGQDRRGQRTRALGPAGLREAQRGMRLATELGLPLVTVVDTPGAALSPEAEEGGLAAEIARCLAELIALPGPTLCVLLGEGSGGAALALVPADRVVAAEHAWLSPLPPEAAAAVLYRTTERADEMAGQLGIRAVDLRAAGLVDRIVAESPGAGAAGAGSPGAGAAGAGSPGAGSASVADDAWLPALAGVIDDEVHALVAADGAQRRARRRRRFRTFGASGVQPGR